MDSMKGLHIVSPIGLYFYYKEDCHLCDQMQISLTAYLTEFDIVDKVNVVMCDIEDDPQWFEQYREYVPVLVVNDEEICHYFFDREDFDSAIRLKGSGS
jgi:hypothetical protein